LPPLEDDDEVELELLFDELDEEELGEDKLLSLDSEL
jgi:hypothetical protein